MLQVQYFSGEVRFSSLSLSPSPLSDEKMSWVIHHHQPQPPPASPPPPLLSPAATLGNKMSPNVLLIIVLLAVVFFISGLLHLLIRYFLRPISREPDDLENVTALQGQLQQLFHLHDSGVDQSFIDTLPVFLYRAIIGLKDPFDCAVCLCEFEGDDKLRLLPKCSHAFHLDCIDTWLLSHSTCPLCRRSLLPDFSPSNSCSPIVLVLESAGSESSREIGLCAPDASHVGCPGEDDTCSSVAHSMRRPSGDPIRANELIMGVSVSEGSEGKVVPVKLGKFRSVEVNVGGGGDEGSSSSGNGNCNIDQRRCFSMGSYEYVMDDSSLLQVAIKPPKKKPSFRNTGHRAAMSECDCHSRREGFRGFDSLKSSELKSYGHETTSTSSSSNLQKKDSFSISKIWLRPKKKESSMAETTSRRAFSFRLSLHRGGGAGTGADSKVKSSVSPKTGSEFGAAGWEEEKSDMDVEFGSCNDSVGGGGGASQLEATPSFARRTLLWIAGRQKKIVNHV